MKKVNATTKLVKGITKQSHKSILKFETLDSNAMRSIRGGDGEGGGGTEIIIIIPKPK